MKQEVTPIDGFHYSTNEQFTGKYWIDGKKIYQIIEVINLGDYPGDTRTWITGNLTIPNVKEVTNITGIVKANNGTYWTVPNTSDTNRYIFATFGSNKISVVVCTAVGFYTTATITIQYTKTTD